MKKIQILGGFIGNINKNLIMQRVSKSPSPPPRKKSKKSSAVVSSKSSAGGGGVFLSMQERALVNLSECIMKVESSLTSNDLLFNSSGKSAVVSMYPLAKVWGYRTGPDGEHESYEKETHGFGQPGGFAKTAFQEFTDMLFRNIDEIKYYETMMNLRSDDTLKKLNSAIDLFSYAEQDGPLNKNFKNWAENLMISYIKEKKVKELFENLAYDCDFRLGPAYVFLSGVALALAFVSKGEWDNAKTTYILLKKLFVY
jgi:hypothetical protein